MISIENGVNKIHIQGQSNYNYTVQNTTKTAKKIFVIGFVFWKLTMKLTNNFNSFYMLNCISLEVFCNILNAHIFTFLF